ncbi:hypothetical protein VTO73DRAFT_4157 [Trametes versicolor]
MNIRSLDENWRNYNVRADSDWKYLAIATRSVEVWTVVDAYYCGASYWWKVKSAGGAPLRSVYGRGLFLSGIQAAAVATELSSPTHCQKRRVGPSLRALDARNFVAGLRVLGESWRLVQSDARQ